MSEQVTVTFTADVNAVTDALLAMEAWAERMYSPGGSRVDPGWVETRRMYNALGPIVLAMRAARDEAIAGE